MGRMNGPVRLVLAVELAVTAEPIAGLVRAGDRPGQAFSGWSELFAVLQTLISQAGGDADVPDQRASDRHARQRGNDGPARRQEEPPC
jgi:hypothetical protein